MDNYIVRPNGKTYLNPQTLGAYALGKNGIMMLAWMCYISYDINAIKKPTEPSVPPGVSSGFVHTNHAIEISYAYNYYYESLGIVSTRQNYNIICLSYLQKRRPNKGKNIVKQVWYFIVKCEKVRRYGISLCVWNTGIPTFIYSCTSIMTNRCQHDFIIQFFVI